MSKQKKPVFSSNIASCQFVFKSDNFRMIQNSSSLIFYWQINANHLMHKWNTQLKLIICKQCHQINMHSRFSIQLIDVNNIVYRCGISMIYQQPIDRIRVLLISIESGAYGSEYNGTTLYSNNLLHAFTFQHEILRWFRLKIDHFDVVRNSWINMCRSFWSSTP